ncbi:MAG: hypothetical protein RL308_2588 [Bacteroidota bacterium]|jgi:DNA polymerase III delta prime subunit
MIINKSKHIDLIQKELIYQINEFEKLLNKYAAKMFIDKQLYLCRFQGFDESRGNIIVKFNHSICKAPRQNEHFHCFISELQNEHVQEWGGLTYKKLREQVKCQFESRTIFFKYEENETIVGISGIKVEDVSKFKVNSLIFLAPMDPPLRYIQNLLHYLKSTKQPSNPILDITISQPNWSPNPLVVGDNTVSQIQFDLIENDTVIIQGPPGTGKTYLMALLCSRLLKQNNRILVTALTNRALIELAEKDHLQEALNEGNIYKASLTADESKNSKLKGIQAFKNFADQKPPLLLATYYKMTDIASKAMEDTHFDYIIIEEASQALLSTIAIAKKLGKKCIIIGDINQLEPIFHKVYAPEDVNNYHWMINGLKAISYNLSNTKQYILTNSYRLTQNSVNCTNTFYGGLLESKSDLSLPLDFSKHPILSDTFNINGGTSLKTFTLTEDKKASLESSTFILNLINEIQSFQKNADIAILAFNRDSVRDLQTSLFSKIENTDNLLIETIDRVQGLTVDFCILFIPIGAIVNALHPNRFNVATSRAKIATLIISDNSIHDCIAMNPLIKTYFEKFLQ